MEEKTYAGTLIHPTRKQLREVQRDRAIEGYVYAALSVRISPDGDTVRWKQTYRRADLAPQQA